MVTRVEQSTWTIAVPSSSSIISLLTASDTICGNLLVERKAADVVVSIKGYHSDNGVFSSAKFHAPCSELGQSLHFSGVGAHHQNGVAEWVIQTATNMARTDMLHTTLHWPE
jgi:transposase InsO family protein